MEKKYFFDKPENIRKLLRLFYLILVLLVVIDFFIPKHPHFPWDGFPSFYGTYGFIACVFLVLGAKYVLRKLVMRDEDYYDDK